MSVVDIGSSTLLVEPRVACAHCGLDVPDGLLNESAERQFCCAGCRTAFAILHEVGLDRYYDLSERRNEPVRPTGRTYEECDHPAFSDLYVKALSDGLAEVELYLEGVHCASCVWLVERVPLVLPGVMRAELEVRRSLARVTWNPAVVPLSRIARTLDSLGYAPHPFRGVTRDAMRRREDRAMLVRIGVAGAIAMNVMLAALALYSGRLGGGVGGMEPQYERFFRWISLLLVTPVLVWPGRIFFAGAWSALRTRTLHMDVPIALGLAAGYVQGAVNTIHDHGPVYFDGLATLTFALLVGRYLQQRGQRAAADSAELLYSVTPSTARVVEADDELRVVPAEALLPGMIIDVRAGDTFPADGTIVQGRTQLDNSLLTGESRPVPAENGDRVYAGTVNLSAPVRVHVEESGEESRVAKILRQAEESSQRRAPIVAVANRMAAWFVAVVLALALATWLTWRFIDPSRGIDNAIALLIVTCPCALALSTPLAVSMAIGQAARIGIFIKGGDALERLAEPGELLLDKTGTITEARTSVVEWTGPEWVKPLVLAVEAGSSHPIADGFRRAWPDLHATDAATTEHVAGGGIVGRVCGRDVIVGSPAFVRRRARCSQDGPPDLSSTELTPVWIAVDGALVAAAGLGDPVRSDAARSIERLRQDGWSISILSGDDGEVARAVGDRVGVDAAHCTGGATPEAKLARVEALHATSRRPVVMVGDGINDAAAIAAASVGIGVHGGAEACLASSDVYLTKPGLSSLVRLMEGARRTMRVIRRNVVFSIVYNVIGAGLAMTGHLTPLIAAILMPASSLTVVIASWRSRTFAEESL
jgi:P-type Cu2+ transporter